MPRDLNRRLILSSTAALAAALAIPFLGAAPAGADGAGAAFTETRCLSGDGWGAVLSISADNPDGHPVARVSTAAGPYSVAVPPGGYSTLITAVGDQITVVVRLTWSDATQRDLGTVTAERPGVCTVASAVATTPPTTTCDEAIPPRADCAGAATAPPATAVAAKATDARFDTGATLLALHGAAATAPRSPIPTSRAASLPVTGAFPAVVVAAGLAAVGLGLVLRHAGRRAAAR